ncbi:MAG: hypothetical protein U9Q69_00895 [Nanoarchaeota archaeon]|nr:hypothetical protein [Nanoarchaeota archaeon]
MVALFNRKTRDWREDDYILLEDLKNDPLKEEKPIIEENKEKSESVKERLERIYKADRGFNSDVKSKLEKLKNVPNTQPKPILGPKEEKKASPSLKKIEQAIRDIENIKNKMHGSNTYLSLFYDLKKAEKNFLKVLDLANEEDIEFPDFLKKKIDEIKSKVRLIK